MSLEVLNRHSETLFEFLWCPVCGQEVFTHIPFEGVFCKNCNTQVELQESRETPGYEEAVLACFESAKTWNLHVDEGYLYVVELLTANPFDEPGEWTVKVSGHSAFPRWDGPTEEAFERASWQFHGPLDDALTELVVEPA
jgi:hypothetical protein